MAEPVRARRLSDQEGQRLQQIVRRGKHGSVRVRRAMIIMASASGTLVPAIARLVAADEDTVRDVIHLFNQKGLAALDPQWAEGCPTISDDDIQVIVTVARTRPEKLGQPFTRWSLRKLATYLADGPRPVRIGAGAAAAAPARPRHLLPADPDLEESTDPDRDAKLDRIEYVTRQYPDRCFAFDQFGPLSIRPCHGTCWARRKHPVRLRANYHRTHGIRYFHGCYSLGDDQLWGVTREHKGAGQHPGRAQIDPGRPARRLPAVRHPGQPGREQDPGHPPLGPAENVELCLTPTSASWANPIEAHFGPLRTFVIGTSDHPNDTALARKLQGYLRWRNAHARHPDVLAAQRRERARIRSERQQRWAAPDPKPPNRTGERSWPPH